VKPIPATVAAPTSGGQGSVNGSRPRRRRVQHVTIEFHAGVGQCEERDDDVAGPRSEEMLKALVRRDGEGHAAARRPGVLRSRLLPEQTPAATGALEIRTRGGCAVASTPRAVPGKGGVDAGRDHCQPQAGADEEVRHAVADTGPSHDEDDTEECNRQPEHRDRQVLRVGHRDKRRGPRHRRRWPTSTRTSARSAPTRCHLRQNSQRKRGVGPRRDAPAAHGGLAGVERHVDERRRRHAADRREDRRGDPSTFA
jgi:hypothetical protein